MRRLGGKMAAVAGALVAWVCAAPGALVTPEARADDDPAAARPAAPTGPLEHDATLRLAAARNLGLLARSLEARRAEAAASAARRPYVPELAMEGAYRDTLGQERRALEWIPRVTWALPQGTSILAEATIAEGLPTNPESRRTLFVELSQAILRNGFVTGAGATLDQADLDVRIAKEAFRAELNDLLARADRAYWDLVFARGDVELKRRGRDRARVQFEETTENIRRGLLAPGDVFLVEESVVSAEERLNRAEEDLELSQSGLRRLLDLDARAPVSSREAPVDVGVDPPEVDSDAVVSAKHPAVVAARLAVERARVGAAGDTNQALPSLDAFGSLAYAEGTDTLSTPIPDDPELRAGLRLSIPLTWGPDTARVARARTELAQRLLEAREIERATIAEVRDAGTRLRGRQKRLELANRIIVLSQKKLEVEQEKYKSGLSTLTDVVRFQRELDEAASSALRAKVEVLAARTQVLAARGDLHESLRIVVR